jgi:hypothetical protein
MGRWDGKQDIWRCLGKIKYPVGHEQGLLSIPHSLLLSPGDFLFLDLVARRGVRYSGLILCDRYLRRLID